MFLLYEDDFVNVGLCFNDLLTVTSRTFQKTRNWTGFVKHGFVKGRRLVETNKLAFVQPFICLSFIYFLSVTF